MAEWVIYMEMTPVQNERLSDKIVIQIVNMIRDGSLKPGDKLPNEALLSEQLGVSRGILREALTRLQSQGYIRRKPKDGTYIQNNVQGRIMNESVNEVFKKATYSDLLDFRETLEIKMIERVIERASNEEIEELFDNLGAADDEQDQHNMDRYFHYKLAQASKNIFYMNFIETYYDLINEIAKKNNQNQDRRNQIAEEHRAIAAAVAERDREAARKAVHHHMRMVDRTLK